MEVTPQLKKLDSPLSCTSKETVLYLLQRPVTPPPSPQSAFTRLVSPPPQHVRGVGVNFSRLSSLGLRTNTSKAESPRSASFISDGEVLKKRFGSEQAGEQTSVELGGGTWLQTRWHPDIIGRKHFQCGARA